MANYCLDASALVLYISNSKASEKIINIMMEIETGKSSGFMSVVNLAEFHRAMTRIAAEDKADMYVIWLKESKIDLISPSIELSVLASVKKQKYASSSSTFAWGDAFCLATAVEYEADYIITSDQEFDKVREISIILI